VPRVKPLRAKAACAVGHGPAGARAAEGRPKSRLVTPNGGVEPSGNIQENE
jgi:hypothetical protein